MKSINEVEDLRSIITLQQEVATSNLELSELMKLICERTQIVTMAAGAVVEIVHGDEMVYEACTGTLEKSLGVRLKKATSLSGLSVQSGEVLYCKDSETDGRVDREACRRVGARSMICVPLTHNKVNIGVLKVVSPEAEKFSEREIRILQVMTGLLSAFMGQAIINRNLVHNENKFRTLFNSSNEAIAISKEGICTDINPAFTRLFGYTPQEYIGQSVFKIVSPRFLETSKNNVKNKFEDTYELECVKKDGTIIEIEGCGKNISYNDEEIRVTTIRDITVQKKSQRALVEAMEAKTSFIANMSHEVRTPLNGILGMANLLEETEINPEQKKYINILKTSADNLLTIVNDILDFSKIEAKKLDLENIPFPLIGTVEDVRQILSFGASKKGLVITANFESKLPEFISGDPTRVRQVLMNLLSNAIKFTEKGEVQIIVKKMEKDIYFSVKDTGIGITEETRRKIFLPFTQADASTTRRFGGTGLGLSICKQLVEMMGGQIGVNSEMGKGSEFWFQLPLLDAQAPTSAASETKQSLSTKKLNILVAEDNAVNALIARAMIEKLGHLVTVAENGEEAVKAIQVANFDLILMDCQMPIMDGFEATAAIRGSKEAWNKIPIIAVTANAMAGDRERCIAAGMNDYISKPFKKEELLRVIK